MVLSIICIVLVAAVAYFHWAAGFFSATISMAFAVLASTLAIGCHEAVVSSLLGGKMADMANGMVICVIFAAVYGVGRIAFDSLIPGNVRLPLYVDKVGGAVCGLVAGVFAVGTVAVAAQSLPFGPSIAGFSRFPLADDKQTLVPGKRNEVDATIRDALAMDPGEARPKPEKAVSLLMPVDAWVVGYVEGQSSGGSLAGSGSRSFVDDHPSFLTDLFFARVGIEPAAKHSALNIGGKQWVTVPALYAPQSLKTMEGELPAIRQSQGYNKGMLPDPVTRNPNTGDFILIVRAAIKPDASEADNKLRFGMGQARLVIGGNDYFPVGTLHIDGATLLTNRIDDYLLAEPTTGSGLITVDLAYQLKESDVLQGGGTPAPKAGETAAAAAAPRRLKAGSFFEFKRYGRVDLSDMDISYTKVPATVAPAVEGNNAPAAGGVLRKPQILKILNPPIVN